MKSSSRRHGFCLFLCCFLTFFQASAAGYRLVDSAEAIDWAKRQSLTGDGLLSEQPCTAAGAEAVLARLFQEELDGFAPDTPLTRAQAITLIWERMGMPEVSAESRYTDTPAESEAAFLWADVYGITVGTGDGLVSPDAMCTNEQFLAFLYRSLMTQADGFELPLNGTTGIASVKLPFYKSFPADIHEEAAGELEAGEAFTILRENGDWWQVAAESGTGWVEHRCCLINLPDVLPSALYDNTNSYSSLFASSGKRLRGVTGEQLYDAAVYNSRFQQEMPVVPMLYTAAKKVAMAQQYALREGNCILIYEAYRPAAVQRLVAERLRELAEQDKDVKSGIDIYPWSLDYFINSRNSNHQAGIAIDVSMVKVAASEIRMSNGSPYRTITRFEPYRMPTAMHELSSLAASTIGPGWDQFSPTMNQEALRLREYFTRAGMTPLESEWWHFNAYDALPEGRVCQAEFETNVCKSLPPEA